MSVIKTTCPYCGVGCGVNVQRDATGVLPVAGDKEHPSNLGRLCVKGSALHETLSEQRRLLYPQISGARVSWDHVLDDITARLQKTILEHGPQSVALYLSGQLLTEDYYVANKLWKGFVGSANVDTNSRLCMSSAVAAHVRAFGEDVVPGCYEDVEIADLVVLVGSNSAWAHPVLHQRLLKARKERGTKIVVIDPRRTASCDQSDLHLPLKPGADAFLFNGLLAYLSEQNFLNHNYIKNHTRDFDAALNAARASAANIQEVARVCGLEESAVEQLYRWFAQTPRTVTLFSQGINQSSSGTDKGNAIINCHLATGRVGLPGASPFSITGQPNAMGGREVGGLANQLAVHRAFTAESITAVGNFWRAPNMAQTPGLKAVALFEAVERGDVKFLWILATNPLVSMPEADRWRRALQRCETVIVSDCVLDTDTTQVAQILLPAAGWGEKDGTVTSSERTISRQRAFLPCAGEAKPDWWALSEIGKRLGFTNEFSFNNARDVFIEHAALTGINSATPLQFDISELSTLNNVQYDALAPVQWPIKNGQGSARLFSDGRFATADHRARFLPIAPQWSQSPLDRDTPLVLNTGRVRDQWHTMTRTAESERLNRHRAEPYVEIHPQDAAVFGLANNEIAEISNRHGKAWLRVRIEPGQHLGSLFVPMHWNDQFAARARVDVLVTANFDPHSGQPELKHASVRVRALPSGWRGLLLSRERLPLTRDHYWAAVPVANGWLYWLAGDEEFNVVSERLLALFPAEPALQFVAPDQKELRSAWIEAGKLEAVLMVGESELVPDPWWLASQLGNVLEKDDRRVLLSGKPSGAQAAQGAMICSCFQVAESSINGAIAGGCQTSAALGEKLRCGTNCGSCVPELNRLIREHVRAPREIAKAV
ncbi:MAG: nitrate reductase [Verrucomicrobiaceae bacterium]|nr:nitrate reductase [Verrucomicrobiaceae bacterium]